MYTFRIDKDINPEKDILLIFANSTYIIRLEQFGHSKERFCGLCSTNMLTLQTKQNKLDGVDNSNHFQTMWGNTTKCLFHNFYF